MGCSGCRFATVGFQSEISPRNFESAMLHSMGTQNLKWKLIFPGPLVLIAGVFFVSFGGGCRPAAGARTVRLGPGQALQYRLALSRDLRTARVSLRLPPAARGRWIRLPRTAGWQLRRWRIARVHCDGHRLYRDGDRGWRLPGGCRRATWRVRLTPVGDSGYRAFSLLAAYHAKRRWAFLPGAGYLLEVAGIRGRATLALSLPEGVRAHHGLDRLAKGRLLLPEAPLAHQALVGVGPLVERRSEVGGVRVRHLFAEPPPERFTRLLAAHHRGLGYLLGVFGRPRFKTLIAWWFRLGPSARMVSGYAGQRSVALSYVGKPKTAAHLSAALLPWLPLVMLLHEQVHQLGVARPAWLSESLAQYYALKALGRSGAMKAAEHTRAVDRITRPWSRMPKADARIGLLAAHRRYVTTGSVASYRVFYTNGARFWWLMDRAIRSRSHNGRSLDSIVRKILRLKYDRLGRPSASFGRLLEKEGGPVAKKLLRRWL